MSDSGAPRFRKLDLHVHTPWSACYSDAAATPQQIVDSALAGGLDGLAVTDHNTFDGVDAIRQAAEGTGVAIFPGVELSTPGGHMLVVFDPRTRVADIAGLLDSLGLAREEWGDGTSVARETAEGVLRQATGWGGLAIAAHIERWPSGFLETTQPRKAKMSIHASEHLGALEITVPQNRRQWNEGLVRGYPRKRACTQGSDAHQPGEIGRRAIYARLDEISLDALRDALRRFTTDIAFPDDLSPEPETSTCRMVENDR